MRTSRFCSRIGHHQGENHYEQDRSALKKKEWERRTQEVQQDEDLFSTGFNLFGEPYKTNKGDALANRVQNTLGNYDEMKELLTSHSNQSHLVGIPKNSVPQTPVEKNDQPSFFTEAQRGRAASTQPANHTTSMPPPPTTNMAGPSILHGHQSTKKSRSSEWSRGAHGSGSSQAAQAASRGKQISSGHEQEQGDSSPGTSSTSTHPSRRHGQTAKVPTVANSPCEQDSGSPVASTSLVPSGLSTPTFPQGLHCKPSSGGQQKPTAYVRPMDGQDQAPNDSPELKPTLEITDGYGGAPFTSLMDGKGSTVGSKGKLPKLTLPQSGEGTSEPVVPCREKRAHSLSQDGPQGQGKADMKGSDSRRDEVKANGPGLHIRLVIITSLKLTKVSLPNDSSCVEEILREMTHSWPPPLTAIHTPGKAEQTKFPIPNKDPQHVTPAYIGQKRCNVPGNKPSTKPVPQKSMLEDDLKISSDEEDSEQAAEKPKTRSTPPNRIDLRLWYQWKKVKSRCESFSPAVSSAADLPNLKKAHASLPGPTPRSSDPGGHSSGASGSSSESESSSESDSDSESSSSDSECNRASRAATPEPEPPSTNKWQLDKWLNKVNPHNKPLANTQLESHRLVGSQPEDGQATENQICSKSKPSAALAQAEPKDRALLSPIREKAKPKTGQKGPDGKGTKIKPPPSVDLPPSRRSTGKKQPKKVEQSLTSEEHNWPRLVNSSTTPKEKEPPPLEPPKPRGKAPGGKTAPRKEPRSTTVTIPAAPTPSAINTAPDKKKHRGPSKIIPKSKEFIETESSSSECHSDPEDLSKVHHPCPGPSSLNFKSKDCNSNILSVSSLASTSSTSIPDPAASDLLEEPLFSPISMVQNELLSPLQDFEDIKSLWVKIELSLLSRIPGQDPPEPLPAKTECRESNFKHRRQQSPGSIPLEKPTSKSKRKHKANHCEVLSGTKKLKLEKETLLPPCISPIHNHKISNTKDSSKKQPRKLLPPLLSPLSDEPMGRQRRSSESSSFSMEGSTQPLPAALPPTHSLPPSSSSSSSSSCHKHRKGESKSHSKTSSQEEDSHTKTSGGFLANGQAESNVWPNPSSLSMDNMEHRRPKLTFNNTVHNADYYMQEAKKLKHKADALMEKFGKAVNYADGALSFIECGNAMERDPLEAKSPYTMYSETVELIRYAMRLKNFTSHSATLAEKKLAVLCNRCLSLLYLRMFKLKKDHAMKYSRSLMEYFKNSAKSSQAPSPWGSNGKTTGTPSPMSLSPSPISSVNSNTGAMVSSSSSSSSSSGSVAIPQRIHHMAASHVNITNNILRSYEHWDTADKLAHESQEFFQELDSVMEPLTQHSSMTDLVRYIRQGLHWLRIEAHLL
ncbi:AF4/FMR2 family member 2 [Silurus asotus]|uniref:AF4/FMR2 family member 2 n=1 Tax=Silurus asotus TaxID=30991 RepID=A0AAD5AXM2_SILAS|nr:AF4/FMR2 family member 2 [Silurus asotus]